MSSTAREERLMRLGRPRLTRWSTVIMTALTVVASALVPASPVAAQGSGDLFWDDEGSTFASFGPNESVTIAFGTIGFGCDAFFPTADVYVMSSSPALGGPLTDLSGTPNTVFGATGGLFSDTIAFTKPTGALDAGAYTVVYDECQDGDLDPDDTVFPDVFTVRELPTDVPPLDSSIQALKAGAGTTAERYSKLSAVIDSLEKAQKLQEALECVTGPADCLVDAITGAVTDAIIEQVKLGLGLPTADPKVLARDVLADNIKHYKGIEADPPDPAFRVTTTLAPVEALHPEGSTQRTLARFALANTQAQEGALAEALLHAIERYQGADLAGSGSWARIHAREARDLAELLAAQLGVTNAALASLRGAVVDDPGDLDTVAANLGSALSDLRDSGITVDAQQQLLNLGLDRTQIADAAAQLLAESDLSGFTESAVLDAIDEAAAANTDLAGALASTADGLDLILTQLDADPTVPADAFPTADAGGPYAASAGSPIALAGIVSDSQGTVPSADWDLDRDGQFDDAAGTAPTVTFYEAFDGIIGLRAADADGHVTVAYARAVIDGGHPPTATFSPSGFMPAAPIGESTPFHADATDQDGDTIAISWHLDGDPVASGPDFSFAPTAADAGPHLLEASVTDGSTTISHFWAAAAVFEDADADGWTANVDCDDSSVARNPGLSEITGNGIDDDCTPFTIDDGPPIGPADITLASGTGGAVGSIDPNTEFSTDGGATYAPSYIITPNPHYSLLPGTQWIDPWVDPGACAPGLVVLYRARFTLPPGFSAAAIQVSVHADNAARILLNGTQIGAQLDAEDARNFQDPPEVFGANDQSLFREGTNELSFAVRNFGCPEGLDYLARVAYTAPSGGADGLTLDPVSHLIVAEGATGSVSVTAAASEDVELTVSDLPSFASFVDNGDGTGTLTAAPTDDAEAAVVVSACSAGGCQRQLVHIHGVNVAPLTSATSTSPITENGSSEVTASQVDPGDDTFTYAFDCDGDGTFAPFQGAGAIDCPFPTAGFHEVGVQVRDDDGGIGTASTSVIVRPVSVPVAEIARVDDREEGSFVLLDGRASSDPEGDQLTFAWQQTGGPAVTLSGAGVTRPSFIAPDNGEYTFELVVGAGNQSSAPADITLTVGNLPPTVEVSNDGPIDLDQPVTITATATDLGAADTFTYEFDCEDDGAFATPTDQPAATCTFGEPGSHVVGVRVRDDDGGAVIGQTTVEVNDAPEQGATTLVLIDSDSIDNGMYHVLNPTDDGTQNIFPSPRTADQQVFPASGINDDLAASGLRAALSYFENQPEGTTISLFSGQTGDEGWFAPACIPGKWIQSNSSRDVSCLSNDAQQAAIKRFINNDQNAIPQSRLDRAEQVRPLRALGLAGLIGRDVCAVVFDDEVSPSYANRKRDGKQDVSASLQGATYGIVAFRVIDVVKLTGFSSSTLPEMQVLILKADDVCGGPFEVYDAPIPKSSSVPNDIDPDKPPSSGYRNRDGPGEPIPY